MSKLEVSMRFSDLLVEEFDAEVKKTRTSLERVPSDNPDFAPHAKSAPLGKLAAHLAQLGEFGLTILTTAEFDFSTGRVTPLVFESAPQLVAAFDQGVNKVRPVLAALSDDAWLEPWKLSFQGRRLFEGTRFMAHRAMFINHMVHHRAQLGVYLRLSGQPVPSTYGPSADERLGF